MAPTESLRSPLRWPGGKAWAARHILPILEARPHKVYAEVFGGGLGILAAKPLPPAGGIEIINDLNSELIQFWRCLKHHPEELVRQIGLPINSRQLWGDAAASRGKTDIQRAADWWYANRCGFAGGNHSFGVRHSCPLNVSSAIVGLQAMATRLGRVTIENLPWERFLKVYDRPGTFLFLDPPYIGGDIEAYAAWTHADLTAFAGVVKRLKGDWLMTFNDCPEVRAEFYGCWTRRLARKTTANNRTAAGGGVRDYAEILIAPECPYPGA